MEDFILERVFASPVETVWRTWTDPELFSRWYKPMPSCETTVLEHTLEPGGVMRVQMKFGADSFHFERWEYETIRATDHLQWRQMLTDADDNIVGNQRMPDWPKVMLTTIDLEPHDDGTLQRLTWIPHEGTDAEIECFKNASEFLDKGWVAGFESQSNLLEQLKA